MMDKTVEKKVNFLACHAVDDQQELTFDILAKNDVTPLEQVAEIKSNESSLNRDQGKTANSVKIKVAHKTQPKHKMNSTTQLLNKRTLIKDQVKQSTKVIDLERKIQSQYGGRDPSSDETVPA